MSERTAQQRGTIAEPTSLNGKQLARIWHTKAKQNTDKYGTQSAEIVALKLMEEAGEIAEAIIQHRNDGMSKGEIAEEIDDVGALLFQLEQSVKKDKFAVIWE